jgi:predicted ArsR family transcriptional regulator
MARNGSAAGPLGQQLGSDSRRGSPTRRLTATLEAGGYEPVTDHSGTIRLRNCPFDALVESHRTLVCGANLAMAEGIGSGTEVRRMLPVLDPQPGYCCVAFVPEATALGDSVKLSGSGVWTEPDPALLADPG